MSRFARRRRLRASSVALVLIPLVTGAATLPHIALKRSIPAAGSRLATPPSRISLWFTEKPQPAFSRIRLAGPGATITLDSIRADTGNSIHARVPRLLGPGAWHVEWQTASADGHPIKGEFTFAVAESGPSGNVVASIDTVIRGADVKPLETLRDNSGFRSARWLEFVAVLTALGVLGFRHGVLPPLASRGVPTSDAADRARRLGQGMIALYVVAVVIRLYTQSVALNGDAPLDFGALRTFVTSTTWGIGWAAGLVGSILLFLGWAISARSVTIGTPLALTGALGLVLSPALSGHAATGEWFVVSVTVDMLHVTAAGLWVGGLAIVLFAGIPAMLRLTDGNRYAAVSALVNSFHPLALFCAPLAVASGLGAAWLRMGGFGAQWMTAYGQTLLLKIGFVMLLAGMGAYNSLRARRRLNDPDGGGTRHFRLTGAVELALAAAVVIVTTFLVVTPTPGGMVAP